jgi:hypothetical protein
MIGGTPTTAPKNDHRAMRIGGSGASWLLPRRRLCYFIFKLFRIATLDQWVIDFMEREGMVTPGKAIVVGQSGGGNRAKMSRQNTAADSCTIKMWSSTWCSGMAWRTNVSLHVDLNQ